MSRFALLLALCRTQKKNFNESIKYSCEIVVPNIERSTKFDVLVWNYNEHIAVASSTWVKSDDRNKNMGRDTVVFSFELG